MSKVKRECIKTASAYIETIFISINKLLPRGEVPKRQFTKYVSTLEMLVAFMNVSIMRVGCNKISSRFRIKKI